MTSSPSPQSRPPSRWRASRRCASLSAWLSRTEKRSTALLSTLFTFCPPGPPERAKESRSSTTGRVRRLVMRSGSTAGPTILALDQRSPGSFRRRKSKVKIPWECPSEKTRLTA